MNKDGSQLEMHQIVVVVTSSYIGDFHSLCDVSRVVLQEVSSHTNQIRKFQETTSSMLA